MAQNTPGEIGGCPRRYIIPQVASLDIIGKSIDTNVKAFAAVWIKYRNDGIKGEPR